MKINEVDNLHLGSFREIVTQECSDFLSILKEARSRNPGTLLYSGRRFLRSTYFGKSREERHPKDSSSLFHNFTVDVFSSLGIDARRDNSIFTTVSKGVASGYGNVYIIFPVNGFKYSYTRYNDLVFNYHHAETKELVDEYQIADPNRKIEILRNYAVDIQLTDKDLLTALLKRREILINGSYYAIDGTYQPWVEEFLDEID